MHQYTYDMSRLPPNWAVDSLATELRALLGDNFRTIYPMPEAQVMRISVNTKLQTQAEVNKLNKTINYHQSLEWAMKVGRYSKLTNPHVPPFDQDFATALSINLHKDNTVVWQGDILQTVYYAHLDPQTGVHGDPVIQWDTEVEYLPQAVRVVDHIGWVMENGEVHPSRKRLEKLYLGQRWLDWLEGKRVQIIAWLRFNVARAMMRALLPKGWTVSQIMETGGAFFGEFQNQISSYQAGYDQAFVEAVKTSNHEWLDEMWYDDSMTIREKFDEQLVYTRNV